MSSKAETMKKKKSKRTLTPKLRFPEFRDALGWEVNNLSEISSSIFDGTHQTPTYTEAGIPFYSVENLISGNANKFISREDYDLATRYNKPEKGDILLTRIGKIGFSQVVTWDHEFSVYVTLAVIKRSSQFNSHHLHCLMQSPFYQSELRSKSLTNAVPPKINMDSLRETKVLLPSPAEQQKIAECLGSLDGLIAAEGRKLAALCDHKRGLMQQLFPQPGQTQPRLRFPEFRDKGEWENEQLGSICKFVRGPFGGALKKEIFVSDGFAVYEQWHAIHGQLDTFRYFIDEKKYQELRRFAVKANDIIMSCSGTMGRFTLIPQDPIPGVINQALLKLTVGKPFNTSFILRALELPSNLSKLLSQSAGGAIKNVVGVKDLKAVEIQIPRPAEQQKIADCLTSLDTQIAAQTAKIESFKQHKRGLMQQLFPAPEEK